MLLIFNGSMSADVDQHKSTHTHFGLLEAFKNGISDCITFNSCGFGFAVSKQRQNLLNNNSNNIIFVFYTNLSWLKMHFWCRSAAWTGPTGELTFFFIRFRLFYNHSIEFLSLHPNMRVCKLAFERITIDFNFIGFNLFFFLLMLFNFKDQHFVPLNS